MSLNQYAVYQLKPDPQIRPFRYKSYEQLLKDQLTVDADNYHQVYLATMLKEITPEEIRRQLETKLPLSFMGSALNVSDVIAVTKKGISTAYYVDKTRLVVLPGFFRFNSSAALITMNTSGFSFDDRTGNWMAADETVVDGKQFFLMVSEKYGRDAAYAVVDAQGRKAAEDTEKGFDDQTIQQIRDFIQLQSLGQDKVPDHNPKLELYQKYYENGEYLRSAEIYGEQNYDMIDGRTNNQSKAIPVPGKRKSVLQRLAEKQKEIALRYGKKTPIQEIDEAE